MSPEDRMAFNKLQYEILANYVQNGGWVENYFEVMKRLDNEEMWK